MPVDGRWHETVPTFLVRHRATWQAARRVIVLEKSHNMGNGWRVEFRLASHGEQLVKVVPAELAGGVEFIQRVYGRER